MVIENLELGAGVYNDVSIAIIANNINDSYVQEADDTLREITVAGGTLALQGMELSSGTQKFTVEFSLAQALQYQSASGRYLLAPTGIRIENNLTDAALSGQVNSALFNTVSPCDKKTDPQKGNRVYLYKGTGLSTENLADVFTTGSTITAPDTAQAPFAVASLIEVSATGNWEYAFGYLPAGDYTMAFACDTGDDDAVEYDDLLISLPEDQVYEVTLSEAEKAVCNLTAKPADFSC